MDSYQYCRYAPCYVHRRRSPCATPKRRRNIAQPNQELSSVGYWASLISRMLKRHGIPTPSAIDQTVDEASMQFFGWLVEWLDEDLNGALLLDAGCWNAPFGVYLRASGTNVGYVGVDLSHQALRYARGVDRGLQVLRADLVGQTLPFAAESFDGVVLTRTYEHLPRGAEPEAIRALVKLLKPGGWLLVTTELNSILNPLDPAWPFGHRHYSPGDLVSVFQGAGLEIEATRINGGVWHCLQVIAFYVAKYIFRRRLYRPAWLRALTIREYEAAPRWLGSHLCFKCRRPAG